MKIYLKTVGDRIIVDACGQPADADQSFAIEAAALGDRPQFLRRVSRMSSAAAADVYPEFIRTRREAALQSAHDGCCNARRVPVHPHDRTERLEPEGVTETREESRCSVILNNSFGDGRAESGHPFGQPLRNTPAMKRKVCDSGAFHIVILSELNFACERY